jgi:hypothetical protein
MIIVCSLSVLLNILFSLEWEDLTRDKLTNDWKMLHYVILFKAISIHRSLSKVVK